MFGNDQLRDVGGSNFPKRYFAGNYMKCLDMYRKVMNAKPQSSMVE